MLNVSRLRVLREVIERGSFSAAADALSYTPSAVSQAIATLESETGVMLVERDRRGVRPTPAGATLVSHAEGILFRLDVAEAELQAVAGMRAGRLRLASFPTAGATLLPPAIAAFRAAQPDVEISLAEGEPDEIAPRLRAGEFDLALLFSFPGADRQLGAGLWVTELFQDPMHVALPRGHRLARAKGLRLEDLRDEAWIQTSADSPCAQHVVRSCHVAGFEPTVSFESDDYLTVQGLVAAGVGVALIPQLALAAGPGVTVRALDPESPTRSILVATRRRPAATPAAMRMVEILRDAGAGRAGDHPGPWARVAAAARA
jgi:DNA-binding transcriptional LysR family regulator